MAKYSNKTCYDCGIMKPANQMERVTESYNSGRSDRRPDAANVAGFIFSDAKTSRNMIKGALTKNNRRQYTRNRTVWKCEDCSGTADWQRGQVRDYIQKAVKTIAKGENGGMFSEAKQLPVSVNQKLEELRELDGTRSNKTARELFEQIQFLVKTAPAAYTRKEEKMLKKIEKAEKVQSADLDGAARSILKFGTSLFVFITMILSGAMLAFFTLGSILLVANNDFTQVNMMVGTIAFSGVVFGLSLRSVRKRMAS